MSLYIFETFLLCGALLVFVECQWFNADPQTIGRLVKPPGWDESTVSLYEPPLRESEPTLPELFDARFHWHNCTDVISRIGAQGHCGSCWAFAVAHAISDRICIASRGASKPWISAQDLMECTGIREVEEVEDGKTPHGSEFIGEACMGNWPAAAWAHYTHHAWPLLSSYRLTSGLIDVANNNEFGVVETDNCNDSINTTDGILRFDPSAIRTEKPATTVAHKSRAYCPF